jgi:hypothetical protein
MHIAVVVVSIVLAAILAGGGIGDIFNMKTAREAAVRLGVPTAVLRFIGCCQIAAAFGLIAGLFWPPLAIAAATGVVLLMICAVAAHMRVDDPFAQSLQALGVLVLAALVLAGHVWLLVH